MTAKKSKQPGLILPASLSSPQDLAAVVLEIRAYARWYLHVAIKKRVGARKASAADAAPTLSPAAAELIGTLGNASQVTSKTLDGLIRTLEDYKKSAPTITITMAAPPTNGLKQTLVAWCRQSISPDALVSFSFNSTLLGGMVVRYGSHVYDWSFRRQILDGRGKFPEILRAQQR